MENIWLSQTGGRNLRTLSRRIFPGPMLAGFCAEFLIHGVDVEGRSAGIDQELAGILGTWEKAGEIPVTYAGGIASMEDIRILQKAGKDRVDFTVGSALDLFGGELSYDEIRQKYHG